MPSFLTNPKAHLTAPRALPRLGQLETVARRAMLAPMVLALTLCVVAMVLGPWSVLDRVVLSLCLLGGLGCILAELFVPWDRVPATVYLLLPTFGLTVIGIAMRDSGGWNSPFFLTLVLPVTAAGLATSSWTALPVALYGGLVAGSPLLYTHPNVGLPMVVATTGTLVALIFMVDRLMRLLRFGDSSALEESRVRKQVERHAQDLITLQRVSAIVGSHLSLDDALKAIVNELRRAFGHQRIALYLREGAVLIPSAQVGFPVTIRPISLGAGPVGIAAETDRVVRDTPRRVAIPLRQDDDVVGVLAVEGEVPFDESDHELLDLFAAQVSVVLRNAHLAGELRYLAQHDALTGLLNRRTLMDGFEIFLASEDTCAVLMIDLNNFKVLNDTFGHLAGDTALRDIGQILKTSSRGADLVGRFGGDEFIMVLPGVDRAQAEIVAARLHKAVRERPFRHDGVILPLALSIGVGACPEDGRTTQEVLSRADAAMYGAKSARASVRPA